MLYPTELRTEKERNQVIANPHTKKAHQLMSFFEGLLPTEFFWSEYKDSNLGPPGPKPGALPDCATLRQAYIISSHAQLDGWVSSRSSNFAQIPLKC